MTKATAPAAPGTGHIFNLRVYFEDTDAGGIVYHASYARFMERARTELLRHRGISQGNFAITEGAWFAVRRLNLDFLKPAKLDDMLRVVTQVEKISGASVWLWQTVERDDEPLVRGHVQIACLDGAGNVRRLPQEIRNQLSPSVAMKSQS